MPKIVVFSSYSGTSLERGKSVQDISAVDICIVWLVSCN